MARINIKGLLGTVTIKDESGKSTSISGDVWIVMQRMAHYPSDERMNILVEMYDSKLDWKNGDSPIDVFGGNNIVYSVSNKITTPQGQDVYSGDGSTTQFAFTKDLSNGYATREGISLENYLQVIVNGNILKLGADYTITFNLDGVTGLIDLIEAPSIGTNNVKLKRMRPVYDKFFRRGLVEAADASETLKAFEFLKSLDGTDSWDEYGINYTSFTEDATL